MQDKSEKKKGKIHERGKEKYRFIRLYREFLTSYGRQVLSVVSELAVSGKNENRLRNKIYTRVRVIYVEKNSAERARLENDEFS